MEKNGEGPDIKRRYHVKSTEVGLMKEKRPSESQSKSKAGKEVRLWVIGCLKRLQQRMGKR